MYTPAEEREKKTNDAYQESQRTKKLNIVLEIDFKNEDHDILTKNILEAVEKSGFKNYEIDMPKIISCSEGTLIEKRFKLEKTGAKNDK